MFFGFRKILRGLLSSVFLLAGCQNSDLSVCLEESQKPISAEECFGFKENSLINLQIKSIYVGRCSDFQEISKTLEKYGANAVVIDVKNDFGQLFPGLPVPYNSKNRFVTDKNFQNLLKKLKKRKIYAIARVVALKEFTRDDLCIRGKDRAVIIDKEKMSWMDPRSEKVLQYLEEICTAAVKIGFDEVQLDYVRFSSYFRDDVRNTNFRRDVKEKIVGKSVTGDGTQNRLQKNFGSDSTNRTRINAVNNLTDRITSAVHRLGGKVSVCVFGSTIEGSVDTPKKKGQTKKSAEILGQDYIELAERADYVCPMIYPSHYPRHTPCGIEDPDLEPYKTVSICMKLSNDMFKAARKKHLRAKVRPYLQAFTAKWLKNHQEYGKEEINDQIRAVLDSDSAKQWGLFHMAGKYP